MLFQIVFCLSIPFIRVHGIDERQAGLIILPPIILGYDDLNENSKENIKLHILDKETTIKDHIQNDVNNNKKGHSNSDKINCKDVTFVGKLIAPNKKLPCRDGRS